MPLERKKLNTTIAMNNSFLTNTENDEINVLKHRQSSSGLLTAGVLDLKSLMGMKKENIKRHWAAILDCVDWIYSEAGNRNVTDTFA